MSSIGRAAQQINSVSDGLLTAGKAIKNFLTAGLTDSYGYYKREGKDFLNRVAQHAKKPMEQLTQTDIEAAMKAGIKSNASLEGAFNAGFKDAAGDIRWGRVAGTASALSIGWRFATGGGIYRDKNGNFDVAGVPFI